MDQLPKEVFGKWRHAYEEDEEGIAVYRPADYAFAPSRGREGIEINRNGTFARFVPGRNDAPESIDGKWKQEDDSLVGLSYRADDLAPQKIEIAEVNKDVLKIRKL